ncbi:hypothetical protein Q6280_27555, partial [Klebsiella pneumoniae]|uniref:hypothetical protein n=1 Tax=Klebsiella pneumoniae TaxID=573 RepID=UPI00272F2DAF
IDHGFIHSLYSFDPNNIPIEFSAPVAGVDLDRRPRMRDRHPLPAAREGAAPVGGHWPAAAPIPPAEEREIYPGEGTALVDSADDDD